jgi:hypothetical protein
MWEEWVVMCGMFTGAVGGSYAVNRLILPTKATQIEPNSNYLLTFYVEVGSVNLLAYKLAWNGHMTNLEDVRSPSGDHWDPGNKEEDAGGRGEGPPPGPQQRRPHVHNARHQTLHDAELAVDADRLEERRKRSVVQQQADLSIGAKQNSS